MKALDLKLFGLLDGLSSGELDEIAGVLEPLELAAGARVFEEGEAAAGLLLLAEGRLVLHSTRAEGRSEFGPGTALGTLALVEEGAREASAETLSRSRLWLLRRSAFERLVELAPRAACRLLQAIVRENAALLRALADERSPGLVDRSPAND